MCCYTLDFFSLLFNLMSMWVLIYFVFTFVFVVVVFFRCFVFRFLFLYSFSFLIKNYSAQTVPKLKLIFHFMSCKWFFIHNGWLDHLWTYINDKVTHTHTNTIASTIWMLSMCMYINGSQLKFPNRNTCRFCM